MAQKNEGSQCGLARESGNKLGAGPRKGRYDEKGSNTGARYRNVR